MIYLIFLFTGLSLLILYMLYNAHHDHVDYLTINDKNLPQTFHDFRIFFISDVHRRNINENTLQSIKEKVDIVIIGGDLTEKGVPLKRTKNNIRFLKKQWNAPVYFVWGNNDYEGVPNVLYDLLVKEGIIVLTNSNVILQDNGDGLSLLGLDCCQYKEARLDLALQGTEGAYKILVTHAPSAFFELEENEQQKIHTVLAGHTHGGQIRILGFGLYPKGCFQLFQGTNVLVSEGYGYTRLPFRLGTKSECHVITLKNRTESSTFI